VNLATGAATLIGSTGVNNMFGLAYNPLNGKLYATESTLGAGLYEIDKSTGAATFLSSQVSIDGLTFVGSSAKLVGFNAGFGGGGPWGAPGGGPGQRGGFRTEGFDGVDRHETS
jgi:hypothetical protein